MNNLLNQRGMAVRTRLFPPNSKYSRYKKVRLSPSALWWRLPTSKWILMKLKINKRNSVFVRSSSFCLKW